MSEENKDKGYRSRKFLVTTIGMMLGTAVTLLGAFMTVPDGYWGALPGLFLLFGTGIGAYNWGNVRQGQNGK